MFLAFSQANSYNRLIIKPRAKIMAEVLLDPELFSADYMQKNRAGRGFWAGQEESGHKSSDYTVHSARQQLLRCIRLDFCDFWPLGN